MENLSDQVKEYARNIGFDLVGITKAEVIPEAQEHYFAWVKNNLYADMTYMAKDPMRRSDPQLILPEAKSIIMLGINYYQEDPEFPLDSGRIARYARGKDYHKYLEKMLQKLIDAIKTDIDPDCECKYYVDYGPFLERAYAEKAGIGFIGKNANLISREFGSYIFLSEIITTLDLQADKPHPRLCGTCTACLEKCPTKAIIRERTIDSNLCISYHTIESSAETIPPDIKHNLQDRLYGCDICQEVCPHNIVNAQTTKHEVFLKDSISFLPIHEVLKMTESEFQIKFQGRAIKRAKLAGLKRNAQALSEH